MFHFPNDATNFDVVVIGPVLRASAFICHLSLALVNLKLMFYEKETGKIKHSNYSPMGPREFWEVTASRFRDIGT
jgi:hypothetical protein